MTVLTSHLGVCEAFYFQLKNYENPLKIKHNMIKLREKTLNFIINFDQPPTTAHHSVIHG